MLSLAAADAATYRGVGAKPGTSYVIYIPDKLDMKKRHPWILGFSPDGNGQQVASVLRQGCDDNGWILVASNNSKNGMDFRVIDAVVVDTINSAVRTLPVDPGLMYAGGLSGGAMVSHWLVAKYPQLVKGLVINCGMINRDLQKEMSYPSGKDIVFMTNPQDFRYHEIREDFGYVTKSGCNATWMEFSGGHAWAPAQSYSTAFKWLNQQAKIHAKMAAVRKVVEPSPSDLRARLKVAQNAANPDQLTIAKLFEQIADFDNKNGKPDNAQAMYKQALEIRNRLEPDSPDAAVLMKKLGEIYAAQDKYADAEPLLKEALSIQEQKSDPKAIAQTMESYAKVLYKEGKTIQANQLYSRLQEMHTK